ncbi:armadillo-type protein [Entophlyctis helioformis]|nr:armadillo-type protein [Entophlyctis helioformis]
MHAISRARTNSAKHPVECSLLLMAAKVLPKELRCVICVAHVTWINTILGLAIKAAKDSDAAAFAAAPSFVSLLNLHASNAKRQSLFLDRASEAFVRTLTVLKVLLTPAAVDGKEHARLSLPIGLAVAAAKRTGSLDAVQPFKDHILKFLAKTVIVSKTITLAPFFEAFTEIVVLKVFDYATRPVAFDTSRVFREKFADTLLNQLKSTNEITLAGKSADQTEIGLGMSTKSPLPDHRILYWSLVANLPILGIDTNEPSVAAALQAFGVHFADYLSMPDADDKVIAAACTFILGGLKDAKTGVRKAYLGALVPVIASPEQTVKLVQAAGIALLDPKKETPAFFIVAALQAKADSSLHDHLVAKKFFAQTLTLSSKAFLFNDKFYRKLLLSAEEQLAFLEVVIAIVRDSSLDDDRQALANAIVWALRAASHLSTAVSKDADILQRGAVLVRLGLGSVLTAASGSAAATAAGATTPISTPTGAPGVVAAAASPDSDANIWGDALGQRALLTLLSILPTKPHESLMPVLAPALMDLAVIASLPSMVRSFGNDLWVSLCFRCDFDPRAILQQHAATFIPAWLNSSHPDQTLGGLAASVHPAIRSATISCLRLATEIATDSVLPILLPFALGTLRDETLTQVTRTDLLICETPADELFDDPLVKAKAQDQGRASNADENKRAKSGKPAAGDLKLSKADRELRQQQFAAEAAIRSRVSVLKASVSTALDVLEAAVGGVLESLGDEAREEFGVWTGEILATLLDVIKREQVVLFVSLGATVFTDVHTVEEEIDAKLLAALVLRSVGVDDKADLGLPAKFLSAPLAPAINRLLEALVIEFPSSSQLPVPAFAFVFPLLQAIVAREGRIAQFKEKTHTGLVMTCSDVLLAHCTISGSPRVVPRRDMASVLVQILDEFPRLRSSARDGLLSLTDEEIEIYAQAARHGTESIVQVLLDALLSNQDAVRESALGGLAHLPIGDVMLPAFDARVWLARSDGFESVRTEADKLWEDVRGEETVIDEALVPDLQVRDSAGRALAKALALYPGSIAATLPALFDLYSEKAQDPMPDYDEYGVVIPESLNKPDEWGARTGIAHAIKSCVAVLADQATVMSLFDFFIEMEALGDRSTTVQERMLDAALAVVHEHAKDHVRPMLDVFDKYLSNPARACSTHDRIREGVVILLGAAAQHLDASDPRIPEVVQKLVDTLRTPSELVQIAVSECLPPLIKVNKDGAPKLISAMLDRLFTSEKYGDRRGSAYGLAGVIKGYGIGALKELGVMSSLKIAVEDKKNPIRREGALLAYETLSFTLGRTFEPYVIQLLPLLLVCYGDANKQVREATEDTCRVIMSKLSAHCVKLVLPSLLIGLQDKAWRSKTGSIEVMASMSALAPRQLSQSLPTIIPGICEALADSHQKVQESARQALVQFGNVIKNPEIQELTDVALTALLDTTFVHYIDAPSLALLVPIIHRGLRERGAEIKKRAAQITGNMASLTEQSDLVPYLPKLNPSLKDVLMDPVPEKLGEDRFPGLVTELLETLKSDTSAVDRSGAAQGLSEVLSGLGISRLEGLLPEIIANTGSVKSYVREGFITLLVYLPSTFGETFTPYLATIIPAILQGLADESDAVRDASLSAGKVVVRNYAKSAISLLMPELERGLFDTNWRIRQNSMQLLGDLLFRIAGVSGKVELDGDQDEGFGTEHGRQVLRETLGVERFERVLASIYIIRGDSSAIVRQSSLLVWKAIVSNTPRTLKEILPQVMNILLASLASPNLEKRGVAARTLGDLVRRMGEGILDKIVPILENGLESDDPDTREGVCVGMTEIMTSAGKAQVAEFVLHCTSLVKKALVDSEPSSDSTGYALEALKEIMAVRSNVVFPVLIPTLLAKPITRFNAQALGSLISVAGLALNRRLSTILPALLNGLHQGDEAVDDIRETLRILLSSIEGDDGVHNAQSTLSTAIREGSHQAKYSACGTREPIEPFLHDWLQLLIGMMSGSDGEDVLLVSWQALDALVKRIKKDDMDKFVQVARRGVRDAEIGVGYEAEIPGYNLPKGISPILPIFLQGLMYGSPDTREQSALGISDLVSRTSEASLKPYVTQITGPLIRVIGDRFPSGVKSAILSTMAALLRRVPAMLKPFLPQLQRTFVKALSDATGTTSMRDRAARCLSLLIPLQARLDPLVVELSQGLKTAEDAKVKPAVWEALYGLVKGITGADGTPSKEISELSKKTLVSTITETIAVSGENDGADRAGAAKCFGAYCAFLSVDDARALVSSHLLNVPLDAPWHRRQGVLSSINAVLAETTEVFQDGVLVAKAVELVCSSLTDDKAEVTDAAVDVGAKLLTDLPFVKSGGAAALIDTLIDAIHALKTLAKTDIDELVPALMTNVRDRTIPIKLAAERALVHVFQIKYGTGILQNYLDTLDAPTARSIGDYARRVLVKIGERDSDTEDAVFD